MPSALVVDDDPHVCALMSRALTRLSFECVTAGDGDEAFAAYSAKACDAVVTDLRMPRRHGHALAVELLRLTPRPKIVVLTGLMEPKLAEDLVHRGVDEIVQKPANFDVLARTVQRLVAPASAALPAAASPPPENAPAPTKFQVLQTIEKALAEVTGMFAEQLTGVFEVAENLSDPPPAVDNFITRQAEIEEAAELAGTAPKAYRESRVRVRARCHATALAVPVDANFVRCGEPFKLAVRDVSESGIRLLNTRATNAKHLALSWTAETLPLQQISLVAKVMRCRPLSPFYDIGGQFVLSDL